MKSLVFSPIIQLIEKPAKVLLTAHTNPDGDAVGSLLGLFHFLKGMGHEVHMMVPNNFPDFLKWMPGQENILIYSNDPEKCKQLFGSVDLLFSLDYNSASRLEKAEDDFRQSPAIKILVDHHIQPELASYDHCLTTSEISSTAELVYLLMKEANPRLINKQIADCICTGIMTDTGSFSYNCNFESTFNIISELIAKGTSVDDINRKVYANNSEQSLRLLGFALSRKLKVLPEFKTAYIALTRKELHEYQYKTGDTEGLVNYALGIRGIAFAALFTERTNKIRISLRSVGDFSVNEFARNHFSGGGHKNAAGGDSFENMEKTLDKFERLLKSYVDKLKKID